VSKGILDFGLFEATCIVYTVGGGWLCHFLCLTLDMGGIVYAGSQRRLNMALRAYLRYIYSLRRLDHVSHLQSRINHRAESAVARGPRTYGGKKKPPKITRRGLKKVNKNLPRTLKCIKPPLSTWRQVLWALRWLIMLGFSFYRFFTKCCMSGIRANCFRYFVLLRPRVRGIW
jgi:hypothetical protein